MFEVKMPREIKAYKEKLVLGMTLRQLICWGLALIICVPTYLVGYRMFHLPEDLVIWAIMGVGGMFGFMGYYQKNGMSAEKYIWVMIQHTFIQPQKRKYRIQKYTDRMDELVYEFKLNQLKSLNNKKGGK